MFDYQDDLLPQELPPAEDWAGFKRALLGSSFRGWINQDPAIAALIAAAVTTGDVMTARNFFGLLAQSLPPSPAQLEEWQVIANQYNIVSIRFTP